MTSPRSILITGASSGIGRALALHYATPDRILVLGGRDAGRLEEVAALCWARGASVETALIDVTNAAAMRNWVIDADQRLTLDLVIANAGISGGTGGGGEEESQVRAIFDINLNGVLNTILPLLPRMKMRSAGQLALVSSLAGFSGWPGAPAYSASKAGVRIYGEALRGAFRGSGVRVNVICPGFVESRMTAVNDYAMPFMMAAERAAAIIARGLARNRGRISFPLPTLALARAIALIPLDMGHVLLTRLPQKPAIPLQKRE